MDAFDLPAGYNKGGEIRQYILYNLIIIQFFKSSVLNTNDF